MDIKYFTLSSILHLLLFSFLFFSWGSSTHLFAPFSDEDNSYLLKAGDSDIQNFVQTEAQSISRLELDKEIAFIQEAKQEQVRARELELAEHKKTIKQLKKNKESLIVQQNGITDEIDKLEQHKLKQSKELASLAQEVDMMVEENQRQRQEQNHLKRQQSFAQSVLKESLHSDGSVLRAYRQSLGAHIGSYWKKNKLSMLSENSQCVLEITMLPTRRIENIAIKESSGNDFFDNNAIAAVRRAEPFPDISKIARDKLPKKILVVFNQDSCDIKESRG